MDTTTTTAATESTSEPITETITESNVDVGADDIVETMYNRDDELIGYACKQILEKNTVEPLDIIFYMDVLTPKGDGESDVETGTESIILEGEEGAGGTTSTSTPQETAIVVAQELLLREMSREYQIDPDVSKGVRCFDLPVDGSTWIVQMSFEKRDFREVTLFGGCRLLEWDPETQDCKFYEARMRGSYIGAVYTAPDGTTFGDTVASLEELINGPSIADELQRREAGGNVLLLGERSGVYATAFLGVPRVADNPNFQGGDEGRDTLKEPTNIKTGIDASQSSLRNKNRRSITMVGGLLVACFSVAFALVAYILFRRRRSYRKRNGLPPSAVCVDDSDRGLHYEDLQKQHTDGDDDHDIVDDGSDHHEDEHYDDDDDDRHYDDNHDYGDYDDHHYHRNNSNSNNNQYQATSNDQREYPNLPMSAEAIQMDLGSALKGQLMGVHAAQDDAPRRAGNEKLGSLLTSPDRSDDMDLDETDSWAQADGTIGSLDLQLEPITAEV